MLENAFFLWQQQLKLRCYRILHPRFTPRLPCTQVILINFWLVTNLYACATISATLLLLDLCFKRHTVFLIRPKVLLEDRWPLMTITSIHFTLFAKASETKTEIKYAAVWSWVLNNMCTNIFWTQMHSLQIWKHTEMYTHVLYQDRFVNPQLLNT